MNDLDALLADAEIAPPTVTVATVRRHRHQWSTTLVDYGDGPDRNRVSCLRCGKPKDETRSRRGAQSRNYGNRAELKVANKYGGEKIGHAGGPVDVRGKDFATQVKTHRRLPPLEWRKSFAAMSQDARCPRMLLRFVQGPGLPPIDYFVFQADDFLGWFGKDE